MHRIQILQTLFDAARIEKQAGNESFRVTPVYISIHNDGTVEDNTSHIRSISGNPKYIILCICFPYQAYGRPNSTFYDTKQIAFIDQSGEIIDKIKGHYWGIKEITFGDGLVITDYVIEKHTRDESFIFGIREFQSVSDIKFSLQMLWEVFSEIDINCKTGKEANLYVRYYLKRLELRNATYTLANYKDQLNEQRDLIKRHEELLNRIENIVRNSS